MFKEEDLQIIKSVFERLKKLHPYWKSADDVGRVRLEKNLEGDFKRLEKLGVHRSFSQSLLFWEKEFVDSFDNPSDIQKAEVVFKKESRPATPEEQKALEIASKRGITSYEIVKRDGKVGIKPL